MIKRNRLNNNKKVKCFKYLGNYITSEEIQVHAHSFLNTETILEIEIFNLYHCIYGMTDVHTM